MSRFVNPNDPRWKWKVTCRYNEHAKPPRVPGTIAIETVHDDDSSKDMEVLVSKRRKDFDVEVTKLRD